MRVTFSCLAKRKSPKRKRPHCLRPLRFATGQPAVLGFGGVSLNSRRCASLRHTRALIRQTLRSSAHPQGHGEQNIHTGLCFARPYLAGASASRCEIWAERSNGPDGCWLFGCSAAPPLLAAPGAGRLRGGMGVGAPMLRELTRRGCLNEAATQRSEFHGAPRNRPDAGLPRSEAQGSQTGGRLSFGYFSLAKQRKVPRPPGRQPGSRAQTKHAIHKQQRFRHSQPRNAHATAAPTPQT